MPEEWKVIREFPDYSVSTRGRVRKNRTDKIMTQTLNQQGIPMVGLTRDGEYHKRGVALLVAQAFIPRPLGPFDTPINLDGDRTNNNVDNLMWRPRWYAVFYHKQFKRPYANHIDSPLEDIKTGEVCANSLECAIKYGLIEQDLVMAVLNRTYVWPTYQQFQVVEN